MLRGHIGGSKAWDESQQVCSQGRQGKDGSEENGGEGRISYISSEAVV